MKKYYSEISIRFLDNEIDEDNPDGDSPYEGQFIESFIVESSGEFSALGKIFMKSMEGLKEYWDTSNIKILNFHIDTFYETLDDARL